MRVRYSLIVVLLIAACSAGKIPVQTGDPSVVERKIDLTTKNKALLENESVTLLIKGLVIENETQAAVRVFINLPDAGPSSSTDEGNYVASISPTTAKGVRGNYTLTLGSHMKNLKPSIYAKGYLLVTIVGVPLFPEKPIPVIRVDSISLK